MGICNFICLSKKYAITANSSSFNCFVNKYSNFILYISILSTSEKNSEYFDLLRKNVPSLYDFV